jgi:acetyl-CoA synthetase
VRAGSEHVVLEEKLEREGLEQRDRLDDVMNVAGHRLGTTEFESAVAEGQSLAEAAVQEEIGKFALPANIFVVGDRPKTRSGKIMRRLLEDISNGEQLGDTTTLRDPSAPESIREQVRE